MLRTFIQITALTVTLIATYFWIRGAALLSPKDLAALSGTYWNYSPATLQSLASQKADSYLAGILLLSSFFLQTWNSLWPMRMSDFGINKWGVAISFIFSLGVFIVCFWMSKELTNSYIAQAQPFLPK
jgi:hypothetical protein